MVISTAQPAMPVASAAVIRPLWRRVRFWASIVVVLVLAGIVVGALGTHPGRPLDPDSTERNGSKALAQLLEQNGTSVRSSDDLGAARGTVLLTDPDAYSAAQLHRLVAASDRLVLVRPGSAAARAVSGALMPDLGATVLHTPSCTDTGARADGAVDLPADTVAYSGTTGTRCFGGALIVSPSLVVIGSVTALQNRALSRRGVAAFDVNAISADRSVGSVVWLRPGADAGGTGPATIWDVFPAGAHRAFLWLIAVGALVVLWRARRLGAVVAEALPVVVRSSEIVEGHGRLYHRAGARDRAAQALRAAAASRLVTRFALPRLSSPSQLAAAVAPLVHRQPGEVVDAAGRAAADR